MQTLLNVPKPTTGSAFTTIPVVAEEEHPFALVYKYVINLFPVPATVGLKNPPLTPVPL